VLARERAKPLGDRVRIVEGDITVPIDVAPDDVTEIWHLAAIYDLSVKRDLGMRVNVDGDLRHHERRRGTQWIGDLRAAARRLRRKSGRLRAQASGDWLRGDGLTWSTTALVVNRVRFTHCVVDDRFALDLRKLIETNERVVKSR